MKKLVIILIIFINVTLLITNIYAINKNQYLAIQSDFEIFINGDNYKFDNELVTINNNTYVSLRELSNQLGYDVDWNSEERKIMLSINQDNDEQPNRNNKEEDEITSNIEGFNYKASEEGTLESGIRYKFLGTDEYGEFNLEDFINRGSFFYKTDYKIKIDAETPKEVAEKTAEQLTAGALIEESLILVRYDISSDSWIVYMDWSVVSGIKLGGDCFLKINRSDGTMEMYDDGIK